MSTGRILTIAILLLCARAAMAASLQVQVLDAAGAPVADAIVFLESREASAAAKPGRDVAISQIDKQFSPSISVVTLGTAVEFPNRDKVRHHVYSFSPAKTFELKLYSGTPANPVVFDRVGIAVLGCNIHDNMTAWVVVVDTPYHGRSNASGLAVLDAVPAGSYRLRTWHAGLPPGSPAADQPVSIGAATAQAAVRLVATSR